MESHFISELRWNSVILPTVLQLHNTVVLQKNFTLSRNGYLMRLELFQHSAARTLRSERDATSELEKNLTVTSMVEYHMTKKIGGR